MCIKLFSINIYILSLQQTRLNHDTIGGTLLILLLLLVEVCHKCSEMAFPPSAVFVS